MSHISIITTSMIAPISLVVRRCRSITLKIIAWATMFLGLLWSGPVLAEIPVASWDCRRGLTETTPSAIFSVLENGAVIRDQRTGLEWQRCPFGMYWTGRGCHGAAIAYTWPGVMQIVEDLEDWRVPEVHELGSLIERCRVDPAINTKAFPNTPSTGFWAMPPYSAATQAWYVSFYVGYATRWNYGSTYHRLRLVRDAP